MTPPTHDEIAQMNAKLDRLLVAVLGDAETPGLMERHRALERRVDHHDRLEETRAEGRREIIRSVVGGVILSAVLAVGGAALATWAGVQHFVVKGGNP